MIARSDWNWGTLDRLDPVTGAPQRRYEIAPATEGIAFGNAGRLWAVSEAGSRHIYDHPFLDLFQPFFRWSLRWIRLDWSESDYVPPAAVGVGPNPVPSSSQSVSAVNPGAEEKSQYFGGVLRMGWDVRRDVQPSNRDSVTLSL